MSGPIPINDRERLANLYSYQILDSEEEAEFDEIARIAAYICRTKGSLISFVDKDRQWNKAQVGFDEKEYSRDNSFCAHSILQNEVFEVIDARKDDRFKDNPFVTGKADLRSYTSIPIQSREGYNVGALCVFDNQPLKLDAEQKEMLKLLAQRVVKEMEVRLELAKARKQKEELDKVNKFKDKLLSIVSHDLRAPLNSIIASIGLYEKGAISRAEMSDLMTSLKVEASTTKKLLDNLLQWAKTKLQNFELVKIKFEIEAIIAETLELYEAEANRKEVQLSYDVPAGTIIYAEPEMIKLAIRNLVNNAIKFCRPGDTVKVIVKTRRDMTQILIQDSGVGMASEKLSTILGEGKVESEPGTNKEKGIGLGLILINEFVKANDGYIMASSELGNGTTFTINLPSVVLDRPLIERNTAVIN